ncbi:MAG: hypothetical protein GEU79_11555 [Acidimicrobiia bacterium]|nr:hypothetical protein [Acidimicrobiia bacterium]
MRIDGIWDDRWSDWFGLEVSHEGGDTILSGELADPSALHGVLDKILDLDLSLTSVRRTSPKGGDSTRGCSG